MIKVIDDWYITVEENPTNYAVKRGAGEKDPKGRCNDKVYGYYTSLRNAIKSVRDQVIAERLKDGSRTLPDALRAISEVDAHFEKIMEKIGA